MFPVLLETRLFGLLSEPWRLHTYGLLIATGFLLAMLLVTREAKRRGEDPSRVTDLGFYMLLMGLLGARLLFIVTKLPEYLANPLRILAFWQGGLVWYGGFFSATLFMMFYCRRNRLPFWRYVDLMVPYMALAHGFGRIGCFFAGCCHGAPTSMPFGVVFPLASFAHQAQQSEGLVGLTEPPLPVHPTQLYEALVEFALFSFLLLFARRKRYDGQLFLIWLATYACARFVIEFFRGDSERGVYLLSTSQYAALLAALLATGIYLKLRRHGALAEASPPPDPPPHKTPAPRID